VYALAFIFPSASAVYGFSGALAIMCTFTTLLHVAISLRNFGAGTASRSLRPAILVPKMFAVLQRTRGHRGLCADLRRLHLCISRLVLGLQGMPGYLRSLARFHSGILATVGSWILSPSSADVGNLVRGLFRKTTSCQSSGAASPSSGGVLTAADRELCRVAGHHRTPTV